MPKEPWVNLFVARATRRTPPALTGCVLTHTVWERTGAASEAVASHLKLKSTTAGSISNLLAGLYRYSKECICDCPNFMNRKDTTFKELTDALGVTCR